MEFIINHWAVLIGIVAVVAFAAIQIYKYIKLPTSEQIEKVQQWLLYAVIQAEKALGGGTGQVKLRYVYDMFVVRFPLVAPVLTFERFSQMVDVALNKMHELLANNVKIEEYIQQ